MRIGKKAESVTTFVGPDAHIDGKIEFKGTIRLDGSVKGKIISKGGTLIIGEKAVINADINVDVAIIMGKVNGVVDAMKRIEVYPPGEINGDIQAPSISIDEGVNFNGNCAMKSHTISSGKGIEASKSVSINDSPKIKNFPKNL